jgi:thiol-disulfide isomerase/thioredoxin
MKIISLLLVSVWSLACAAATPVATPAKAAVVKLGALKVPLLDGKTFSADRVIGKYVVLNFWATWCGPCLKEMPDFQKLADTRLDVVVVGLAYEDETDANLVAFLKKRKVTYAVGKVDVYAALPAPLETPRGLPLTWVFDKQGVLLKKFLGPVTHKDLVNVIDAKPAKF